MMSSIFQDFILNFIVSTTILCIICGLSISTQHCNTESQCIGQDIQTDILYGYGYRCASEPGTTIVTTIETECAGSFACYGASSLSSIQKTTCYGSNGCSHLDSFSSDVFECTAANSCTHSTIVGVGANRRLDCSGYKSCAHSHLIGLKLVEARAAYALYNATIDTGNQSNGTSTFYFEGHHAGLHSKLICQSDDICDIHCYGNACYQLYINCIGTCNIYAASIDTIYPINKISDINHTIELKYEAPQSTVDNDNMCNNTAAYNDVGLKDGFDIFRNTSLCCRGKEACSGAHNITISGTTDTNIVCSGSDSCRVTNIIHNGDVYCEGKQSCLGTAIHTQNAAVFCFGRSSCSGAIFHNVRSVFCYSLMSCYGLTMHTAGYGDTYHIYFMGKESGYQSVIQCAMNDECVVLCAARSACKRAIIECIGQCTYTVHCNNDDDTGCPKVHNVSINATHIPSEMPSVNPSPLPTERPNQTSLTQNATVSLSTNQNTSVFETSDDSYIDTPSDGSDGMTPILWIIVGSVLICCVVGGIGLYCVYKRRVSQKEYDVNQNNVELAQPGENTAEMVREWLTSTVGLEQYVELFINAGYDSLEFICHIQNETDLIDIGIQKAGHRKHILSEIKLFKEQNHTKGNGEMDVYLNTNERHDSLDNVVNVEASDNDDIIDEINETDIGDENDNNEGSEGKVQGANVVCSAGADSVVIGSLTEDLNGTSPLPLEAPENAVCEPLGKSIATIDMNTASTTLKHRKSDSDHNNDDLWDPKYIGAPKGDTTKGTQSQMKDPNTLGFIE